MAGKLTQPGSFGASGASDAGSEVAPGRSTRTAQFRRRSDSTDAAPVQRRVTVNPGPDTTVPDADVGSMLIPRFLSYTRNQADWSTSYAGADLERVRQLLHDLIAEPALPEGLAAFTVHDVLAVPTADWVHLRKYSAAVQDASSVPTAKMGAAPTLARATELGRVLPRLETAVGGGGVLYHITAPDSVGRLIDARRVDDFIGYCAARNPQWQAPDGKEIDSFLKMPMFFHTMVGPLADVRNLHHFEFPALVRLMVDRFGGHAGQPLALILHSGVDHSGAFHHDPQLTTAIVGNPNRVIMLEGKETLAEIEGELPAIAATYGAGQIDQVMIAGHGNNRLIELAGSTGLGTTADGRPEVTQTDDTLDLDNNAAATEHFMDTLGGLMGGPNNRIVFNGCLTASNDIRIDPAGGDPSAQIAEQMANNGSLVEAMRARLPSGGSTDVIGANASFPEGPDLMDASGRFDVIWDADPASGDPGDPALTATDKLEYIRHGNEPTGVLRAVLEKWQPPVSPPPDWQVAVDDRLTRPTTDWNGSIITAALDHIAANPADATGISELSQTVGTVSHGYFASSAHTGDLDGVDANHMVRLFSAVERSSEWPGQRRIPPIALYSVWGRTDSTKYAALRTHLSNPAFTVANVEEFLDIPYLGGALSTLLPLADAAAPTRGHLVIACAAVLGSIRSSVATAFLRAVATGGRFDPGLDIAGISGNEEDVLTAIGLAGGGGAATGGATEEREANVDQDGDGTNESWVDRTARWGSVVECTKLRVHSGPRDAASEIGVLDAGDRVFVQGMNGRWASIAFHGETGYVFERFLAFDDGTPLGS